MVRGMTGVSLRALGREWTEVACHADSALALRSSHPDHHLAAASLTSLRTMRRTKGAPTSDDDGEELWDSEEASSYGFSVFRCR
jgi:hypothetical protein